MRNRTRRMLARILRELQAHPWCRRVGRRLPGPIEIVETVERRGAQTADAPDLALPLTVIDLKALKGRRIVGSEYPVRRPPGYPTEYDWWILGVQVAHPVLRGFGIDEAILRAAVQRFGPEDNVCVAGMVNVRNGASVSMLQEVGFGV